MSVFFKSRDLGVPEKRNPYVNIEQLIPGIRQDSEFGRIKTMQDFFDSEERKIGAHDLESRERYHNKLFPIGNKGRAQYTEFADNASGLFIRPNFRQFGQNIVSGNILVDLGAGRNAYGIRLAGILNAKGYVAVESNWPDALKQEIEKGSHLSTYSYQEKVYVDDSKPVPFCVVPEDMLTFLRRLPDNSVSVLTSGIDSNIIFSGEYLDAVTNELYRVIKVGGGLISTQSSFDLQNESEHGTYEEKIFDHYQTMVFKRTK